MVDFGVQATQLSAPQGAGAAVVAPVTTMDGRPNTILQPLIEVGNIFAKGLANRRQEEAQAARNAILSEYSQKISALNTGLSTGQITADRAHAERMIIHNRYLANHPELRQDIDGLRQSFSAGTNVGEAEKAVETARNERRAQIQAAVAAGHILPEGSSEETINATLRAHAVEVRARTEFSDHVQRMSEFRADDTFNRAREERRMADQSAATVANLAGEHIEAFRGLIADQSARAIANPESQREALQIVTERYTNIRAALVAAGRQSPELANAYSQVFSEMYSVFKDMSDPKTNAQNTKAILDNLIARTQLIAAMKDPKTLAAMSVNGAFPLMSPALLLQTSNQGIKAFLDMSSTPLNPNGESVVPLTVDNQKEILDLFKDGLSGLNRVGVSASDNARIQLSTTADNLLMNLGRAADKGFTKEALTQIIDVLANPNFAALRQNGSISPAAIAEADKAIEMFYERQFVDGLQTRLNANVYKSVYAQIGSVLERKPLRDFINVEFTGVGVKFTPKQLPEGATSRDRTAIADAIKDLSRFEPSVSKMIQARAHLQNTTDYTEYWETTKDVLFPSHFTRAQRPSDTMTSVRTEAGAREDVSKMDPTGPRNVTQDALRGVLQEYDKLSDEQKRQLATALEQLGIK
jgi:hypothetical protein